MLSFKSHYILNINSTHNRYKDPSKNFLIPYTFENKYQHIRILNQHHTSIRIRIFQPTSSICITNSSTPLMFQNRCLLTIHIPKSSTWIILFQSPFKYASLPNRYSILRVLMVKSMDICSLQFLWKLLFFSLPIFVSIFVL